MSSVTFYANFVAPPAHTQTTCRHHMYVASYAIFMIKFCLVHPERKINKMVVVGLSCVYWIACVPSGIYKEINFVAICIGTSDNHSRKNNLREPGRVRERSLASPDQV